MKFVLIFASSLSSYVDKLKPKVDLLEKHFSLDYKINNQNNPECSRYEKIIINLPTFDDLIRLAERLKSQIILDNIRHDDYDYYTLMVYDDYIE